MIHLVIVTHLNACICEQIIGLLRHIFRPYFYYTAFFHHLSGRASHSFHSQLSAKEQLRLFLHDIIQMAYASSVKGSDVSLMKHYKLTILFLQRIYKFLHHGF